MCLCSDDGTTLPTLVAELTDSSWCEAVAGVARTLPAASSGSSGEGDGSGSFAIVRKVQELCLQTMLALHNKAPDPAGMYVHARKMATHLNLVANALRSPS